MANEIINYKLEVQNLLSAGLKDAKAHALELQHSMGDLQGNFNNLFKTIKGGLGDWQHQITALTDLKTSAKDILPVGQNMAKVFGNEILTAGKKMGDTLKTSLSHIEGGFKEVTKGVNNFTQHGLQAAMPHVSKYMKSTHDSTVAMLEHKGVLGDVNKVLDHVTAGINTASRAIDTVKMVTGLWKEASVAMKDAQAMLNLVMEENPIMGIVMLIAALALGIYEAYQKFDGFRKAVDMIWEVLKGFGQFLWDYVILPFKTLYHLVAAIFDVFTGDFSGAKANFKAIADDYINTAKSAVSTVKDTLKSVNDTYNTDYSKKDKAPDTDSAMPAMAAPNVGFTKNINKPAKGGGIASALSPTDAMAGKVTGTKQTVVHLNIAKINGIEKATFTNIKESANTAGETLLKALLNSVNQASASVDI